MGYGEFSSDFDKETSLKNYDGIVGIVNEDKLGINKVAIQAKKFVRNNIIDRSEIYKFADTLNEKGLVKGVFITTSSFTTEAINSARHQSIVLIDGEKLSKLMIEYNVGVFTSNTYEIKCIDSDYFNMCK